MLIAVVDGLKGFPEAIGTVFPLTTVQTCIVHLICNFAGLCVVEGSQAHLYTPVYTPVVPG